MEHAALERLDPIFKPDFLVLIPKKARVGEPRPQYAFVAGNDCPAAIDRNVVGDKQKARRRCAIRLQAAEVFLMRAHRRRQHLGRQRHEIGVDRSHQHYRELDEAGDFLEQPGIRLDDEPSCGRSLIEIPPDHLSAMLVIEDDMCLAEQREIRAGVGDADFFRCQKAMAAGHSPDRYPVERQRQHLSVEQADDRGQRPYPAQGAGRITH